MQNELALAANRQAGPWVAMPQADSDALGDGSGRYDDGKWRDSGQQPAQNALLPPQAGVLTVAEWVDGQAPM